MPKSESRGCSTSSAVDQDMCIVVISKSKDDNCQKYHQGAEADGLGRIIEQRATEIVELQNKIRVLEQDLASTESELQQGKAFSLNSRTAK